MNKRKCKNYMMENICPLYKIDKTRTTLVDLCMIATFDIYNWDKIEKCEIKRCENFYEK